LPPPRKRALSIDFDLDTLIPEGLPHFPAPFAMDKIKALEYVELWYFTKEGIMDAGKLTPTAVDDTYGLQRTETGLTLQQVKATRASRNVIPDEALSWEQITIARHNMLKAAASWPDEHRQVLANFFMNLESLSAEGSHPRALILYQATARRRWHGTLKGLGDRFNLANISKPLLLSLENKIRDADQESTQNQLVAFMRKVSGESQFGERENGRGRRRDRGQGRVRSSRSKSPRDKSPPNRFRRTSTGPETRPLSACPICLSRKPHPIRSCQSPKLWDGKRNSHCSRNAKGQVIDGAGRFLCLNWNQVIGCKDGTARHVHECSGCGNASHGAQDCPLAEKASTDDPAHR